MEHNGEELQRVGIMCGEWESCARDCVAGKMWLTITGWLFSQLPVSCFFGEHEKESMWHGDRGVDRDTEEMQYLQCNEVKPVRTVEASKQPSYSTVIGQQDQHQKHPPLPTK